MKWRKLGVVWGPDTTQSWSRSHASLPTPLNLNADEIRVFVNCMDDKGRGRPTFVDVSAHDPTQVIRSAKRPLLDLGKPGAFDDNGVAATCVVRLGDGVQHMYYAGFELCRNVRYRIFTGLAISEDDGHSFKRCSSAPILDRSDAELFFRCGPFVMYDEGKFRLWYIGGSAWTEVNGKALPVYDLRYLESADGIRFEDTGAVSMSIENAEEHGFGRPWVVKHEDHRGYELFYSIRRRSLGAYRLGYATSQDGFSWQRQDSAMGLDVSADTFESDAIMYSAVITTNGRTFCFYNGNGFGEKGFAVAELIS